MLVSDRPVGFISASPRCWRLRPRPGTLGDQPRCFSIHSYPHIPCSGTGADFDYWGSRCSRTPHIAACLAAKHAPALCKQRARRNRLHCESIERQWPSYRTPRQGWTRRRCHGFAPNPRHLASCLSWQARPGRSLGECYNTVRRRNEAPGDHQDDSTFSRARVPVCVPDCNWCVNKTLK
jgi:hypothetical protein